MKERQLLEEDFKKLGDLGEKRQQVIEDVLNLESCRFFGEIGIRGFGIVPEQTFNQYLDRILVKSVENDDYKKAYEKISEWLLPEQISLSKISKDSKLEFLEGKINRKRCNFGVRRFF